MNITGGKYKGRIIDTPNENITRPTLSKVRMGVFNTLYSMVEEFDGKSFLDVFGGSGVMGLEALSRGFENVTVFEKNPRAAYIIKKNYAALELVPNLKIGDSVKLINSIDVIYDVAYIDPPYASTLYTEILNKTGTKAKIIIVEHSEEIDFGNLTLIKTKNYGGKKVSFFESQLLK